MKIYLAGERGEKLKLYLVGCGHKDNTRDLKPGASIPLWLQGGRVKRRLYSYVYHSENNGTTINEDARLSHELLHLDMFLDSGAFTAFTKKQAISIHNYGQFVASTRSFWSVVSSLDHIGKGWEAAQKSYENLMELYAMGVDVKPVWHVREPDEWLKFYLDSGANYILIGGMVPETSGWLQQRLDRLFGEVLTDSTGKPLAKYHGFGLTDQTLMFRYPWYSVDSSSWLMTGVFGSCMIPVNGKMYKILFSQEGPAAGKVDGWNYYGLGEENRITVDNFLHSLGFTAEDCARDYNYRDAVNAAVFQSMEQYGTDTFKVTQETFF